MNAEEHNLIQTRALIDPITLRHKVSGFLNFGFDKCTNFFTSSGSEIG